MVRPLSEQRSDGCGRPRAQQPLPSSATSPSGGHPRVLRNRAVGRNVRRLALALLVLLGSGLAAAELVAAPVGQLATDLRVAILGPTPGTAIHGRTLVTGWAVEPLGQDGSGVNPRDIQVWLGAPPDGYLLDYAQYGLASAEAAAIYGPAFAEAGFALEWRTCSFPPGPHDLWAFVSSTVRP